jgi:hypothetical protein
MVSTQMRFPISTFFRDDLRVAHPITRRHGIDPTETPADNRL